MTNSCCSSESESKCCMMAKCFSYCKWCPLMPIIFGAIFLLLGFFLSAEVVRVLWIILSVVIILMGICCFICMSVMSKKCSKEEKPNP